MPHQEYHSICFSLLPGTPNLIRYLYFHGFWEPDTISGHIDNHASNKKITIFKSIMSLIWPWRVSTTISPQHSPGRTEFIDIQAKSPPPSILSIFQYFWVLSLLFTFIHPLHGELSCCNPGGEDPWSWARRDWVCERLQFPWTAFCSVFIT